MYLELIEIRERVGIPVSESVRRALREYIEKNAKKSDGNSESIQIPSIPNRRTES